MEYRGKLPRDSRAFLFVVDGRDQFGDHFQGIGPKGRKEWKQGWDFEFSRSVAELFADLRNFSDTPKARVVWGFHLQGLCGAHDAVNFLCKFAQGLGRSLWITFFEDFDDRFEFGKDLIGFFSKALYDFYIHMDFVPIRIGTLRPGHPVRFHVHVKVSDKYIHYIQAEEPFEEERIVRLKSKGVKKVFIRADEEPKYLAYLEEGLSNLTSADSAIAERGSLANDSLVSEVENIDRTLETEAGYLSAEGRVGKIIEFLGSDKGALNSVLASAGTDQDF